MNGRIYDPTLGRFLQADPHIQAPTNSQNYNRYSYVLNNPLSYTDPSGYFFKKLFKGIKKYWRQIASIGMMFIPGMQAFAMKSWINAAMVGFASGGIATGSLRGALVGAFSGAALQQIGTSATWGKAGSAENIIANASVGGIAADLNGGKFGHGFFAAGFTAAMKPQINDIGGENSANSAFARGDTAALATYQTHRIVAASVIGGTASLISGGKFANGAVTGAFTQMFNAEASAAKAAGDMKTAIVAFKDFESSAEVVKAFNDVILKIRNMNHQEIKKYFPTIHREFGHLGGFANNMAELEFNRTFRNAVYQEVILSGGKVAIGLTIDISNRALPPMVGILSSHFGSDMTIEYSTKSIKEYKGGFK